METRKAISKRTRFEVFKRDNFTCQYCGKSAPNVLLDVRKYKETRMAIEAFIRGGGDVEDLVSESKCCSSIYKFFEAIHGQD